MRISRPSEFAMVPTWVIKMPEMRGSTTRIAVYVAIRVLAFEHPNRDWASERDLADDLAEVSGVGAEACRKHLRAMRSVGVIAGDPGEIALPSDPPSGDTQPHNGDVGTQSGDTRPHSPLTKKEREEIPAQSAIVRDGWFDAFWDLYPHKVDKKRAHKAFINAWSKVENLDVSILGALQKRVDWWKAMNTPPDKIPYPATWLNGERWLDEIEPVALDRRVRFGVDESAIAEVPVEVADWLGNNCYFHPERRRNFLQAWARGKHEGYSDGELAVRTAIHCRTDSDPFTVSPWCLINVANVSRFSGGVPTYGGAPKGYTELMDRAYQLGKWIVR